MNYRQPIIKSLIAILLSFVSLAGYAQNPTDTLPPDPAAMAVFNYQDLNFGAFSQGSTGGTISVAGNGARSVTGTVVALNFGFSYYPAIFEVEAPEGSIISILNGSDVTLTGSNGGSMILKLNSSYPVSPFVSNIPPPGRTQVAIGGTLTVGNVAAAPPGIYTGTFDITFNQE